MAIASGLFLLRWLNFDLISPGYLLAIESCVWIFAIFGFANKYLDHPSKALSYLSQAAYPVYILHMVFLYLGSYLIFPLSLPTGAEFLLVVVFTTVGCFAFYELIRRIFFLRPLFGLKKTTIIISIISLIFFGCEQCDISAQYACQQPEMLIYKNDKLILEENFDVCYKFKGKF